MIAISKIVGVMACGFLLCLGLSDQAVSAADDMNPGERIGGQAGRGYEQEKWERIAATHTGERIGGQAGRGHEHVNRERVTPHAGERIGAQAGRGYEQVKPGRVTATHAGERIGGEADLNERQGMGK